MGYPMQILTFALFGIHFPGGSTLSVPIIAIGRIGAFVLTERKAKPCLNSLTFSFTLTPPSGKTPTILPFFSKSIARFNVLKSCFFLLQEAHPQALKLYLKTLF